MKFLAILGTVAALGALSANAQASPADNKWAGVDSLDLPKYTGGWYEVLSSQAVQQDMERGCTCSQTYYTLNNDDPALLDVTNACTRFGRYYEIKGQARRLNATQYPGRLQVKLEVPWWLRNRISRSGGQDPSQWPQKDNYIILKLYRDQGGNVSQALVGGDEDKYFWLISRTPTVADQTITEDALRVAECHGYNVTQPHYQNQNECPWAIPQQ